MTRTASSTFRLSFIAVACLCAAASAAAGTITYAYDEAGRLIGADYGGGRRINYSYDANGNLLQLRVRAGWELATAVAPPGSGAVTGAGTYSDGSEATLGALPAASYQHYGWGGDLGGAANPASLTMDNDKAVTAYFGLASNATDHDGDGVVSKEERGPGGDDPDYDGNGNGVPDYQEGVAASLWATTGAYATLSAPAGVTLSAVRTALNPACSTMPSDVGFPHGFFGFTVDGLDPSECTTVTLDLPLTPALSTYYRFAPSAAEPTPHWWEFAHDGTTGAQITHEASRTLVALSLCDGGRGDDDLLANGVIVDLGGPATTFSTSGPYQLMIPATANTPGVGTSRWQSDLDLLNPGATEASVELALLLANQANPAPATSLLNVPAGQTVRLGNVLGSTFNAANAALGVRLLAGAAQVNSRFYNTASACGGTFGMYVPASCREAEIPSGEIAYLHHLAYSPDSATGSRTNIGFANATGINTQVETKLYGDTGTLLKTVTITLKAYEHRQLTRIHKDPAPATGAVSHGWATVRVLTAAGRVYAYAMLIDNRSGDPIFIRPVNGRGIPAWVGYDQAIAAAANTPGVGEARWQTDLDLLNPGSAEASATLALLKANQANPTPETSPVNVPAGQTLRLANVLGTTFNTSNAALGIEAGIGWVEVNSRFYNTASTCGGTYGMYVPAEDQKQTLTSGQIAYFHHLSYSPVSSTGFRVNIGFASDTGSNVVVEVKLYGDAGELLKTVTRTLKAFEHMQLTRVNKDPAPSTGPVAHGHATVRVLTAGGKVHTYAMLIENTSGDPIYMPPEIVTP